MHSHHGAKDNNKKPAAYCRILDYVEQQGVEGERLKDLIVYNCCTGLLAPRHGKGVTLMWPTTKTIDEIEKAVYGSDEVAHYKAAQRLKAHILTDVYNDKTPFAVGKLVNNGMYPARSCVVKKATAVTVEFENGATAELDKGFKVLTDPTTPRINIAVWRIKSGEMQTDGAEAKIIKVSKKKGGNEPDCAALKKCTEFRRMILSTVEKRFAAERGQSNAYMACYASLYNWYKEKYPAVLYNVIIPLTSCTPIDLYLILCAVNEAKQHLLDQQQLEEWWSEGQGGHHDTSAVCKDIISALSTANHHTNQIGLYDATQRVRMLQSVNESRAKLARATCDDFRNCVQAFCAEYTRLHEVAASSNFFPESISELYKKPECKIAHDDLRYVTKLMFAKLTQNWDETSFHEFCATLHKSLSYPVPKATLIHAGTVRYTIDGGRELQPQIYALCASDYLWFFPHTLADSNKAAGSMKITNVMPEVGHRRLWQDLVLALHKNETSSALDSTSVPDEAHQEMYNALRSVLEGAEGAEANANKLLSKYTVAGGFSYRR